MAEREGADEPSNINRLALANLQERATENCAKQNTLANPFWPVGPEKLTGGGWYTPTHSVQLIERRPHERGPRFRVWTFFPDRRIDLRFPPISCNSRHRAQAIALDRLAEVGRAPVVYARRGQIDLARSGKVVGLDCVL